MTFPRSLFRGWLVISLLWVCGAIIVYYNPVREEFARASIARDEAGNVLLPARCSETERGLSRELSARDKAAKQGFADTCWFDVDSYRSANPELRGMSDEELTQRTYDEALETNNVDPWSVAGVATAVAAVPPLALLFLGIGIYWAVGSMSPRTRG
jgi:hypothetical protein